MIRMRRILFATDFSASAGTAFLYALSMAREYEAELHVLHVCCEGVEPELAAHAEGALRGEIAAYAETRLAWYREHAGALPAGLHTHLQFGKRASFEISRFVTANEIALVVIGSGGASGLKRLVHGSTGQRLLKMVRVPVMTVHENDRLALNPADPAGSIQLRKLLVPVDFSECSLSALSLALSLGQEYQAEILVLHVLEDIFPIGFDVGMVMPFPNLHEERLAAARERLRGILPEDSEHWCRLTTDVVAGVPSMEVLDRAQAEDFDLILMGAHGKDFVEELFLGSVTDKVVRNAACPVISMACPAK